MTAAASRLEARYRRHLARCAPELVEHEASVSSDRVLRLCMATLRELRQARLDKADAVLAEAEPLEDWEAVGEARR